MRASLGGRHVSGQERIVKPEELEKVLIELHRRPKGEWDYQSIKIEKLKTPPVVLEKSLPVRSYKFSCVPLAHNHIVGLLESEHNIKREITKPLLSKLVSGIKNGENLPGALIVDPESGEVLAEGVRTILFDWKDREAATKILLEKGYTPRTVDALALATKNVYCGVEAEVCISDDPDYTTGYIASKKLGYLRMTPLKEKGNPYGGRIYFVKKRNLKSVIECLRTKGVLIEKPNL
jgi:6-carboxyhexanoate--CoA ligase